MYSGSDKTELHRDYFRPKELVNDIYRQYPGYQTQLNEDQKKVLQKYRDENKLIDMYNLWINIGQKIKAFPLAIVPKGKPQNTAYYFKEMKTGDAIFFDGTNTHGSLGKNQILDKKRGYRRNSVVFLCARLPEDFIEIVKILEADYQEQVPY
eukprot:NODE_884_length_3321_cov_0.260708.p3 type:complete len:152 gc:universal NODE_884_length_3321_cov_0.260708:1709-1254(-)